MLAHARQVAHVDADRAQLPGVTDPRQLQQLRELKAPPQRMTSPAATARDAGRGV